MLVALIGASTPQIAAGKPNASKAIVCDPLDPTSCSQPLKGGERAPFSGQLLTPTLAIKLGQKARWCDQRWALRVDRDAALASVALDLAKQRHRIDVEAKDRQIELLKAELDRGQFFWKRPWFVATVTSVATIVLISGAIKGAYLLR